MTTRNPSLRSINDDLRQLRERIVSKGLTRHSPQQTRNADEFQGTWVKLLKALSATLVIILFALLITTEVSKSPSKAPAKSKLPRAVTNEPASKPSASPIESPAEQASSNSDEESERPSPNNALGAQEVATPAASGDEEQEAPAALQTEEQPEVQEVLEEKEAPAVQEEPEVQEAPAVQEAPVVQEAPAMPAVEAVTTLGAAVEKAPDFVPSYTYGKDGYPTGFKGPPRNMRDVVVVGNGRSIAGSHMGKIIDSFKTVVRFNLFQTKGLERDAGSRTDTWVLSTIKDPRDMNRKETWPVKSVYIPVPHGYASKKKAALKERLLESKTLRSKSVIWVGSLEPENKELRKQYDLKEKYVSSGLQMVTFYARRGHTVYIVGFDFETGDHQHYWETKVKNETCHNMGGEAATLQKMLDAKVVRRLLPAPKTKGTFGEYDPNCKILCTVEGVCKKLIGADYAEYAQNPEKWEQEHGMYVPGNRAGVKGNPVSALHASTLEGFKPTPPAPPAPDFTKMALQRILEQRAEKFGTAPPA